MTHVFALQSTQIDEWWPLIRPLIDRCQQMQFEWSSETVLNRLKGAEAQFWGVEQEGKIVGGFVTQIEQGAGGLIGRVWIASGDLKESGMAVFRQYIEPWFCEKGCELITFDGRKGWEKVLSDYEVHSIKMVKRLCATIH